MRTIAEQILNTFNAGNALTAFEQAIDLAFTVREASDHDVYRFDDLSSMRVYISGEHEITMIEE
ncbi:hypothetical protein [Vibrio rotiferianus]|uniref:hypothetical protein n=1 Tax=Vibrio rotiferianus TaxID=190895 RepID=UPI0005EE72CE|nr:hypothetical protein [Vibrio rotiferianus]